MHVSALCVSGVCMYVLLQCVRLFQQRMYVHVCVCVSEWVGLCVGASCSFVEALTLRLCIKARQAVKLREYVSSLKLSSLPTSNGLWRSI